MEINQDFKELLTLFNYHKVEYLLVGAYALAFHGAPRNTGDLDLWVNPSEENSEKILKSLQDFGFGSLGLTKLDFMRSDSVIQLGVVPSRIDILTGISGVTWTEAWKHKELTSYGEIPVFILSKEDFILNKKSIGRLKDLADIESLKTIDL